MKVNTEVWELIDKIGKKLVEEDREMTNDEFAVTISSYCLGSLYSYLSIPEADKVVKSIRTRTINAMSDDLKLEDIALS